MALALPRERGIISPEDNFPFPSSSPELDPFGISYEIMRWNDFQKMTAVLGDKVVQSGKSYDAVVSLLRGGKYPGVELAVRLFLPHDTLGVKLYRGIQANSEAAGGTIKIYKPLSHPERIKGASVLLVDDVNDTSTTLEGVIGYFMGEISINNANIAVLHEKPGHRKIPADYVVRKTDSWIVYPWEHDGGPLHDRWEFFRERLPAWMITDEGEMIPWDDVMLRCLAVGFLPDELPSLDNQTFMGWLGTNINERYQEIFNKSISGTDGWHLLFPGRDLPVPQMIEVPVQIES